MAQNDFYERVYHMTRQIPYGRVTSYGAIAKAIGSPRSARVVGYALNASAGNIDIPAHRVVNRNGLLTGKAHFMGSQAMQAQLEAEGISVKNNQVQNFQKYFWQPPVLSLDN